VLFARYQCNSRHPSWIEKTIVAAGSMYGERDERLRLSFSFYLRRQTLGTDVIYYTYSVVFCMTLVFFKSEHFFMKNVRS
jgi:hypothetical protein